jgi:hypothetical protein
MVHGAPLPSMQQRKHSDAAIGVRLPTSALTFVFVNFFSNVWILTLTYWEKWMWYRCPSCNDLSIVKQLSGFDRHVRMRCKPRSFCFFILFFIFGFLFTFFSFVPWFESDFIFVSLREEE